MGKVVVVGGGLSGCGAAAAAAKAGATVTLLERTDLVGGSARLSGHVPSRVAAVCAELRCMGCDEVFRVFDECKIHDDRLLGFPAAQPWFFFDVTRISKALHDCVRGMGVEVRLQARVKSVVRSGSKVRSVVLNDGANIEADSFVDATGGAGGVRECRQYGNGCVMCHYRCLSFGDRVSLVAEAGVQELQGRRRDGSIGAISPAYCLVKNSIAPELKERIERDGFMIIPVAAPDAARVRVQAVTASGVVSDAWVDNVVLVDIGGYANRMGASYTPLDELKQVPGFENAEYADPLSGGVGNSVRYMAVSPRDGGLRVPGLDNLFVAGEKLGINGLGEGAATGVIAGHNAARASAGKEPLVLPRDTILGDFIAYVNDRWDKEGLAERYHFFLGTYWGRLKELPDLFTEDREAIRRRIERIGLANVLGQKVC